MAVTNYLDDYLFVATTVRQCNFLLRSFIDMCEEINVPIAFEKTVWACEIIEFLGILLNGNRWTLEIPQEKRIRAVNMLEWILSKKKATVEEIQKLTGFLNFLCKAVFPGRAFTRRIYSKYSGLGGENSKLRMYHHIKIDQEMKQDCKVWLKFLENPKVVARPFIDLSEKIEKAEEIGFYSDASGCESLGVGCTIFGKFWTYGQWPEGFIKKYKPSIEFLELFALVTGVLTWEKKLINRKFTAHCDNESVVNMVNHTATGGEQCMKLIRLLVLKQMKGNYRISAEHVPGKFNLIADTLSRLKFSLFEKLQRKHDMNKHKSSLPDAIWPPEKVWNTECIVTADDFN